MICQISPESRPPRSAGELNLRHAGQKPCWSWPIDMKRADPKARPFIRRPWAGQLTSDDYLLQSPGFAGQPPVLNGVQLNVTVPFSLRVMLNSVLVPDLEVTVNFLAPRLL